ncbi:MAG: DnaD domain protein [Ruminococcaceae bacterium]|nr:DnaD domain protein [Oscillospiraceae bacterium]
MAYYMNLGAWSEIFAVPAAVVDEHLKIATPAQLKVLLYFLRNSGKNLTEYIIGDDLSLSPEDVNDALVFWEQRGLVSISADIIKPAEKTPLVTDTATYSELSIEPSEEPKKPKRPASRPVRPEPGYVIKRLGSDKELSMLVDEAQQIFGRVISNADVGTLVMLHDTDGLPVDVILMLLNYCVESGKGTMRYIEKLGIEWGNEGINTIALAEDKIRRTTEVYSYFNRVATTFGLKNAGTPTKKQLTLANQWVGTWSFSDDMLRLAYERCVDTKGQLNMDYINGILKKWYMAGFKNPDDVAQDTAPAVQTAKSSKKSSKTLSAEASYDIEDYENKSMFD